MAVPVGPLSSFRQCLTDLAPTVEHFIMPDPVAGLHGADPSAHLDKSPDIGFLLYSLNGITTAIGCQVSSCALRLT